MAEWDEVGSSFSRHDAGNPGNAKDVSLFVASLYDRLKRVFLHADHAFCDGDAVGDILVADIDHVGFACLIEVR
jgi:hypothetical protein